MLTKRIIPCLDIKNGRTVKGVNFENLADAGNPVELAAMYAQQGADEIVFLDISATDEKRKTLSELVKEIAKHIAIPFMVGGGIRKVADVGALLEAGADKVSVNSAAVEDPSLITRLANEFGSQCITVAIDAGKAGNQWMVRTHGGKRPSDKKLFSWARQCQDRGAGEILFTSIDHDGTKGGFAIDPLSKLHEWLTVPVIASGGAGNKTHFLEAFVLAKADAALAASVFHFNELEIPHLKTFLKANGIVIR
jgi:cyclase